MSDKHSRFFPPTKLSEKTSGHEHDNLNSEIHSLTFHPEWSTECHWKFFFSEVRLTKWFFFCKCNLIFIYDITTSYTLNDLITEKKKMFVEIHKLYKKNTCEFLISFLFYWRELQIFIFKIFLNLTLLHTPLWAYCVTTSLSLYTHLALTQRPVIVPWN